MPPRLKSWFAEHIAAICSSVLPLLLIFAAGYLDLRDNAIIARCERDAQREALLELKISLDNLTRTFGAVATNLATLNTEVKHINNQLNEKFYLSVKPKYKDKDTDK